jgi:hypothetical protein
VRFDQSISFSQFSSLLISLPFLSVFEGVHHGHPTLTHDAVMSWE